MTQLRTIYNNVFHDMSPHLEINEPSMYWGKNKKRSDDICGWLSLMYPHHVEKLIPTHHMSSGLKIEGFEA